MSSLIICYLQTSCILPTVPGHLPCGRGRCLEDVNGRNHHAFIWCEGSQEIRFTLQIIQQLLCAAGDGPMLAVRDSHTLS